MADALKVYSVVIAWDDNDDEQGDFAEIVRARDGQHAERITRARMIRSHWEHHWERDRESRWESLSSYRNADGSYFGSVVESYEGAIWKAEELEKALRGLLSWAQHMGGWDAPIWHEAEKIIAEIDAI
ncbi:hypothetical protein [Mesorhizobium silamurunense]|uniref:hypothetical protein n=1 Tax=Mesorhizobium silamurunense TaxID=499528 RepID=UPI00177A9C81|nr:hypothetical protein [Mesorhizobium silamurunense]